VPVVQLGIDETLTPEEHWALAVGLRPLRDEGVLILGSGDVVHNLQHLRLGPAPGGALRLGAALREGDPPPAIEEDDDETVVGYEELGPDAALAAPTPEHFLPLVYCARANPPGGKGDVSGRGDSTADRSPMLGVRIG